MSTVFELEEHEGARKIDVKPEDAHIKFVNADFSWGFKVK